MAFIQCRVCDGLVSTEEDSCPNCGAPRLPVVSQISATEPEDLSLAVVRQDVPEQLLYSEGGVSITTAHVYARGTTYSLNDILSVEGVSDRPLSPEHTSAIKMLWFLLIVCLVNAAIVLLVFLFWGAGVSGWEAISCIISPVVVSASLLVILRERRRRTFHLAITSATGEHLILRSVDQEFIARLVFHINKAMATDLAS